VDSAGSSVSTDVSASQPESGQKANLREKTGCQKMLLQLKDIAELREVQEKKS
jgi:hypothetical protein